MSHIAQYWQVLCFPATRLRSRFERRTAGGRPEREQINKRPSRQDDTATRAEQLEHIAIYARAGFFNMGYTADAFQLSADAPRY